MSTGMTPERAEALRVARAALLGPDSAYGPADAIVTALHHAGLLAPQHTAPTVWWVVEEDGPVRGLYATKDAARQGSIEVYEEMEESSPDYSWGEDAAAGVDLMVGGEPVGIFLERKPVHGHPEEPKSVEQLRTERDQFADRVDTLTAVAKGNKRHVATLTQELTTAHSRIAQLERQLTTVATAHMPGLCPPCKRGDCDECMAVDHPDLPNLYTCHYVDQPHKACREGRRGGERP